MKRILMSAALCLLLSAPAFALPITMPGGEAKKGNNFTLETLQSEGYGNLEYLDGKAFVIDDDGQYLELITGPFSWVFFAKGLPENARTSDKWYGQFARYSVKKAPQNSPDIENLPRGNNGTNSSGKDDIENLPRGNHGNNYSGKDDIENLPRGNSDNSYIEGLPLALSDKDFIESLLLAISEKDHNDYGDTAVSFEPQAVSEPAGLLLLGTGLIAMASRLRRRA